MRYLLQFPRNIYLLSLSQIIGMSANTMVSLLSGLIGATIAPSLTLSTLPPTTMILGIAITTIPAALLMKKIGRKKGFLIFTLVAMIACILLAYAVIISNFYLLCFGTFLIGTNSAFIQQYRFAAIESVGKTLASKAVGLLLFAGIFSGIAGPEIAKWTKDLSGLPEYTAPFLIMSLLFVLSAILLFFMKDNKIHEETHHEERSLKNIVMQPHFFIAVIAAATAYAVMTFIMNASPISMNKMSHMSIDETVLVIQSHVIAMFLPSLFTGILIQRFGVFRMLLAGLGSFGLAILFATNGSSLPYYWTSSVLIGVGWNFLYISSTMLLAQSHSHLERFKAQGLNDFVVVASQMLASLFAGSVLFSQGWINLNLLTLPLILIIGTVFIVSRKHLARI